MNFLNPIFLWALPLASAPILIHLLNRRKPKHILFSHLAWIKQSHRVLMPKKKIQDILILVLRTCLILLLIFFFSRPILQTSPLFSSGLEDKTYVILLDQSASMGALDQGGDVLARAKTQVLKFIQKLDPNTKVGFIGFSERVEKEMAPTSEKSKVSLVVRDSEVKPRPTDIFPAFQLAFQMLNNQPRGDKNILVITDAAKTGWASLLKEGVKIENYDPEVAVTVWEAAPEIQNGGVVDAHIHLGEEGTLQGSASFVSSPGFKPAKDWKLSLDERIVGQGSLQANIPNQKINFEARLPDGGFFAGKITTTPDSIPFDDNYFVAGRVPRGYHLLIVDGDLGSAPIDAESYYFRSALESPRDPRLKSIQVIRPEVLRGEKLDAYDVIFLANVANIEESIPSLRTWVEKGGGLLISAGPSWNSPMQLFRGTISAQSSKVQNPTPQNNLIFSLQDMMDFQWNQVAVKKYFQIERDSTLIPILNLENGDPLLALKKIGQGQVAFLTTTMDRAWTNLPSKPIFAPLIRELVASLADPFRQQTSLTGFVDEALQMRAEPGLGAVGIVAPDGSSQGARVDSNGMIQLPLLSLPGLYRVQTNKKENDFQFALNIKNLSSETKGERISRSEIKSIFPESRIEFIRSGKKGGTDILSVLQGKDLTFTLIVLLFVLLIIETVLAWPRKKWAMALFLLLFPTLSFSAQGNQFVFAQLKYEGAWDPYPNIHEPILEMVRGMTNIPFGSERKVLSLLDNDLFEYPFLLIKGSSAVKFSENEKKQLKLYIDRGGFVLIDDSVGDSRSSFSNSIRQVLAELYPQDSLQALSQDHALFRSFFLLRRVAGRRISEKYLEGLDVGGHLGGEPRTAVVFSSNDIMGAWMKDRMGEYSYHCEPGGETQRWETFKLTLNLIYFSLTGTYKKDAIHQPFIEQKLGT